MVIVFLFVLSAQASAAELDYYGIENVIGKNLDVETTTTLIFDRPVTSLEYNLDFVIMNLSADVESGTERCAYDNTGSGSRVSCSFYGMKENLTTVSLTFTSRKIIRKYGDNFEFMATFPVSMPTKKLSSLIKLPEKSVLGEELVNQSYSPGDGNVLTDGKRFIVSWTEKDLLPEDTLTFSVVFDLSGTGGFMWDISVTALTVVVVVSMIAVGVYMMRGSGLTKTEVKVLPLLNKDEKKIVSIVSREGGEARQRALVTETDFSKAKVSRLLKNLQERGVIDTEPISGRENKVILKIKGVD